MKECPSPDIKKDLDFCMAKFMEQRKIAAEEEKKRTEEAKNAPKIAEVKQEPKEFTKVSIEEDSADSDDEHALQKKKAEAKRRTKMIDEETL